MAMERKNELVITGTYRTSEVTPTFTKTYLEISAKDREGNWRPGEIDVWIKDELKDSSGLKEGMDVKMKGWLTFNFSPAGKSFPKIICSEIIECEENRFNAGQGSTPQMPTPQAPQPNIPSINQFPNQGYVVAPQAPQAPGAPQNQYQQNQYPQSTPGYGTPPQMP